MRLVFTLFCVVFFLSSEAQNKSSFTVLSDHPDATVVDVHFATPQFSKVNTPNGWSEVVSIDQGSALQKQGAPQVPQLTYALIVPMGASSTLQLLESNYTDYPNIELAPSKGKIFRNQDPNAVPYTYGEEYQINAFFPQQAASLFESHTLRDFQGETVHLYPVQYNPVTKVLRVYSSMKVKLNYQHGQIGWQRPEKVDESFDFIYKQHFLNYTENKTRYSPITQSGSLFIVTPGMYLTTLEPFITWKKQKGMKVFVCNTDTLSGGVNEANLKSLAKWYYHNKQIAYMLIVGDHAQVPAVTSSVNWVNASYGPCSDLTNAYINNNDHYPEFIVGRFSAESIQDVQTQVERTLQYEKNPNTSTNWFQYQMGIASSQGDAESDDGQLDYQHICEIMDSNKNQYYYVNNKGFFDGDQTACGDDPAGPSPAMILTQINAGVGLINYCGHGSANSWSTSGFSNSDIDNLTNADMLPFIFSTACSNGFFMNYTCFGETWLRARTMDGKPKGAVAAIMSSIVQDWNPPMEGQDEMNAVLRGARSNNKRTTFGAIVTSGFMAGNDKYNDFADPDGGNAITDTWITFGDPSVEVKTKNEGTITCSHIGYLQQNSTMFYVGCPVEGATITLYYQNELWSTATVTGGVAIFYFDPVTVLDSIVVTATKQNWTPYQGRVDVVNYPTSTQQLTEAGFQLYPNPTNDILNLQVANPASWKEITVLDFAGRCVLKTTLNGVQTMIPVQHLASGSYIIKIQGEKTVSGLFQKK